MANKVQMNRGNSKDTNKYRRNQKAREHEAVKEMMKGTSIQTPFKVHDKKINQIEKKIRKCITDMHLDDYYGEIDSISIHNLAFALYTSSKFEAELMENDSFAVDEETYKGIVRKENQLLKARETQLDRIDKILKDLGLTPKERQEIVRQSLEGLDYNESDLDDELEGLNID